ncbi:MAG: type II toxin-antitoxin system Phd/YefM family antitoxin [Deltaproteobacteria bacterium]|nr:type II toxin-antitoxin system Phd/YefM family antitoxin [Deltaproteobacteria bacterium]
MRTVTLDEAANDLRAIILRAIRDRDETVISSDEGAVVVLDESEWSNIKETLRLLSDKESLAALLESHAIRDRGEKPEGVTPEKAFEDV